MIKETVITLHEMQIENWTIHTAATTYKKGSLNLPQKLETLQSAFITMDAEHSIDRDIVDS